MTSPTRTKSKAARPLTIARRVEPLSVVDTVVPAVEAYLRDFGLTDESTVGVESRVLVGQAMMQLPENASHETIMSEAFRMAYARREDWAVLRRTTTVPGLWDGAIPAPPERQRSMPKQSLASNWSWATREIPIPAIS